MAGNLTRILNNQIYSKTIIASQKIADGTITGSLFSSNVTVPGDFLITGNLFVLGTSAYTTIASTNTYVNDPLITLNNGYSGTNTYDEGLVFNRGSLQNRALIWSEFYQEFRLIGTTETGTTYGNVTVSNYQNLHVGNLTVDYAIATGSLNTSGFINTSGNISAEIGNFGAINSTGLINTTGNVSASQVSVATLNATGFINTSGNVSASQGSFGTIVATGLINTTGNISGAVINAATVNASGNVLAAVFNGGALNVSGNVDAATVLAQLVTSDDATFGNVAALFIGNTGTQFTGASINLSGNVLGAAATFSSAQINGNESVTGYLNVTGNILGSAGTLNTLNLNSTANATDTTSGALQIAGGVGISKDVWIGGNLYVSNIFATSYNILTVNDPLLYLTAANTYPYTYEIGFYSQFTGGAGNIYQHSGIARDHNDGYWKAFSNVVTEPTGTITFNADTKYDGIKAGNLILTDSTASTTTGTGALVVSGGAGIAGAVTAGSFNTAGNVLASTVLAQLVTADDLTVGNVAAGFIGNTGTAYTGASINLSGNVLATGAVLNALTVNGSITSTGYINTSANISGAVINTATLNATTLTATGNVIGGLGQFAAINATPIGNATPSTGAFTDLRATGTVYANATTDTTSLTDGALIVAGGTAIGKTLWVGEGAVINSTGSTETFQVKSSTSGNVAIFANLSGGTSTTESVIIGGANTVVQAGVTLKVGSQTTMMIPVGPTAARPSNLFGAGYDVVGMMRYNTTINNIEFYDGTQWQSSGSTFTVISDRQFSGNTAGGYGNVDGTNTVFTLQSNATTSGTIVSINGVIQFPTLAYSVSGTTLTFTEPPAPTDIIDARILTTTTTVSALASGNGLNQFIVDSVYANVQTGTSSSINRISFDTGGNINVVNGSKITYDQTPTQVTNTNLTLLDNFGANTYTTAKYVVSIKQGTGNVQAMEALVTTNGLNAWITTYAVTNTGNNMGSLSANVAGGACSLWFTPLSGTAISNVKVQTTYIV